MNAGRHPDTSRIGLVSVSDRASKGVYEDQGIPALQAWLEKAVTTPIEFPLQRVIAYGETRG